MKKKILILETASDKIINKNILKLKKIYITKKYKNKEIDNYIAFNHSPITGDLTFYFKDFYYIIVCQSSYNRLDYFNIYLFLKNNGVDRVKVIYFDNSIGILDLKKINKIIFLFTKNLGFKIKESLYTFTY